MKFKVIQIFLIEAKTRNEAIEQFAIKKRLGQEDEFFQTEIVKKQEESTGWIGTLKNQVLGS